MKILCVTKNYLDHFDEIEIKKNKKEIFKEPILFIKPDTAIIARERDFIIPEFTRQVNYEIEIILKINKAGKYIQQCFAHSYYNQISVGINFTASDIQKSLKEKGFPWEKSKAFDQSAAVGEWISKNYFNKNIFSFFLKKNGEIVQKATTIDMIFSFDVLISEISKFFSLKIGDLIFTGGIPSREEFIKENDILEGFLNEKKLLHLQIA